MGLGEMAQRLRTEDLVQFPAPRGSSSPRSVIATLGVAAPYTDTHAAKAPAAHKINNNQSKKKSVSFATR